MNFLVALANNKFSKLIFGSGGIYICFMQFGVMQEKMYFFYH
jgi:hypothetical protein